MKMGEFITEERELIFRSLVLCGIHIVVPLSNAQGRFHVSEAELAEQEIKEIHIMNPVQYGVIENIEALGFKFKGIADKWHVFSPSNQVLHNYLFTGYFAIGDIVQLNMSYKNSPAGTLAFVNVTYNNRIEILTKAGDVIPFNERNAIDHLIYMSSNNSFKDFNKS